LLQEFVLPYDFLKVFGYGGDTIKAYIAVDEKLEYARLQSTMRGPNPLGAYLVIILTAVAALFMRRRTHYAKWAIGLLATMIVLYGTYSRSAWIGAAAAIGLLVWGLAQSQKSRTYLFAVSGVLAVIFAGLIVVFQDNDRVQNVLFHTDETSQSSTSSNEERANAITGGMKDIVREPLGRGPGTAGPASVYNDASGSRIAENYFVQIGQETGVIGLSLFIAISVVLGGALWIQRGGDVLALVLCASLVGLTMVNLLSHAWADDTLAYVWWGMAGFAMGMSVAHRKRDA
jgi:O-antigen ligase